MGIFPWYGSRNLNGVTLLPVQEYIIAGNSMWDPDLTNKFGNGDVVGAAQWSAFFTKYAVHDSEISVTFQNYGDYFAWRVFVWPSRNDLPEFAGVNEQEQQLYTKTKYMSRGDGGNPLTTIKHKMNVKKLFGVNVVDDLLFGASVGTSPVGYALYWHIGLQAVNYISTTPLNVNISVMMKMKAKLWDRVEVIP